MRIPSPRPSRPPLPLSLQLPLLLPHLLSTSSTPEPPSLGFCRVPQQLSLRAVVKIRIEYGTLLVCGRYSEMGSSCSLEHLGSVWKAPDYWERSCPGFCRQAKYLQVWGSQSRRKWRTEQQREWIIRVYQFEVSEKREFFFSPLKRITKWSQRI